MQSRISIEAARAAGRIAAAALFVLSPAIAQAPNDCRIAIIIGNAAYPTAPLANPANDARSMAEALRKAGFEVFEARDAGKAQMEDVIARAGAALKGRHGVGMLYYAGHGLQLDLRDYLVPVDARLRQSGDVPIQTVDLQKVIDVFKAAGNRTNILVLDACRDSPFAASSTGKGLAPIDAPPGTFLAYATAPGNVADDGDASSGNGLYTEYLVRELGVEGARIEDVFKRVRYQVRRKSDGRQVPWESTSLEDDFYFEPATSAKRTVDREQEFKAEKIDWDRVKDAETAASLYEYLMKYPTGLISEQAQFRLDQLQKPMLDVQVRDEAARALPSGTNRYAVGDEFVYERTEGLTGISTQYTNHVTSADDREVVINRGKLILDQMGGVLKDRFGPKDPALITAPAEIAVGKRWRSQYDTGPDGSWKTYGDYRVVALEEVQVAAGRFKAYRVERVGYAIYTGPGTSPYSQETQTGTYWVDPRTMLVVKDESFVRSAGRIKRYDRTELVRYTLAPRQR